MQSNCQFQLVQEDPACTHASVKSFSSCPVTPPTTLACNSSTQAFQDAIPTTTHLEPCLPSDTPLPASLPQPPPPSTPTAPLPTPPLEQEDLLKPVSSSSASLDSCASQFPVKVALLPNRGRSYVATRTIEKGQVVLVAESYGTTMCDAWLDCGVCHFCWSTVPDRKTQIRLPKQCLETRGTRPSKRQPTAMVFCDEKCLQDYGPPVAEMVCRVEQQIRRLWTAKKRQQRENQQQRGSEWRIRVDRAFQLASNRMQLVWLSDQDFGDFLNLVWSSIDMWVSEQLAVVDSAGAAITTTTTTTNAKSKSLNGTATKEALAANARLAAFPNMAQYLLSSLVGTDLEPRTTDDDCEKLRLMAEALCRRQMEDGAPFIKTATQATFADYCAMQSNEVTVVREALRDEMQQQQQQQQAEDEPVVQCEGSVSEKTLPALVALLPQHFNETLYVYLRLRDALYLISKGGQDGTGDNDDDGDVIGHRDSAGGLQVDQTAFRSMLYKEVANSFGIRDEADELLGFAVFPRACFFNHSCDPNVEKRRAVRELPCVPEVAGEQADGSTVRRRTMVFSAARRIEQGEECCISYGDISAGRAERQARLQEMYFFPCSCVRCEQEA